MFESGLGESRPTRASQVEGTVPLPNVKAAPLVRVIVKLTVKFAVCESLRRQNTACLTGILTVTCTSGAALTH